MARVAARILAEGEGSRYGLPKVFAPLPGGDSALARGARTVEAADARPVVATVLPGIGASGCRGVQAIPLPQPEVDMLASPRFGLAASLEEPWDRIVI